MSGAGAVIGIDESSYEKYSPEFFGRLREELDAATSDEKKDEIYQIPLNLGRHIFLAMQELRVFFVEHCGVDIKTREFNFIQAYEWYVHLLPTHDFSRHPKEALLNRFHSISRGNSFLSPKISGSSLCLSTGLCLPNSG